MQKGTFVTTIPHFISLLYLHSLQKANHTSFTSRFKIHETFQINQPNINITFCYSFN